MLSILVHAVIQHQAPTSAWPMACSKNPLSFIMGFQWRMCSWSCKAFKQEYNTVHVQKFIAICSEILREDSLLFVVEFWGRINFVPARAEILWSKPIRLVLKKPIVHEGILKENRLLSMHGFQWTIQSNLCWKYTLLSIVRIEIMKKDLLLFGKDFERESVAVPRRIPRWIVSIHIGIPRENSLCRLRIVCVVYACIFVPNLNTGY